MYVSGGLGSRYEGEAFGKDFELPNERAYAETCAAIGSVMWNWRMLGLEGDAGYADLIEHTLYNAVLPGVSLDGQHYFYQNPLADDGSHRRQPWFGCACCPPNVARLLASLPGYFYSASEDAVWVHLYAEGAATVELDGNRTVRLSQRTHYPWDGRVEIQVEGEGEFALMLRIPAWCEEGATVEVNGESVDAADHSWLVRGDTPHVAFWRHDKHEPPYAGPAGRMPSLRHRECGTRCAHARPPALLRRAGGQPVTWICETSSSRMQSLSARFDPELLGGVVVLQAEARIASARRWVGRPPLPPAHPEPRRGAHPRHPS